MGGTACCHPRIRICHNLDRMRFIIVSEVKVYRVYLESTYVEYICEKLAYHDYIIVTLVTQKLNDIGL
jgi:hypothetical protein